MARAAAGPARIPARAPPGAADAPHEEGRRGRAERPARRVALARPRPERGHVDAARDDAEVVLLADAERQVLVALAGGERDERVREVRGAPLREHEQAGRDR